MDVENKMQAAGAPGEDGSAAKPRRAPGPLFPWLPRIPLMFLGLGLYRAWIEVVFVGSFLDLPAAELAGHNWFDAAMIVTLLVCAVGHRKVAPLFWRRSVYAAAAVLLTLGTLGAFAVLWAGDAARVLTVPSAVAGGAGIALVILLWSELYACLNPFRVALYYSASMIVAALVVYLCRAMVPAPLEVVTVLLPLASLGAVAASFRSLPADELPPEHSAVSSFPWKIVLLMAVYAFAYGLRETTMYQTGFGPHSNFGTVAVAAFVFFGVIARGGKFDFAVIYRIALPLMVVAFLVLPATGIIGSSVLSDFCTSASYTAFSILVMLIMANISYRYGVSAVWLFGIERSVRALFSFLGRGASQMLDGALAGVANSDIVVNGLVIVLVLVSTMILFSEKELSSQWGMTFFRGDAPADRAVLKKQELARRCVELARQGGLSPREEEVLLLLAQNKPMKEIESELFISSGTAKTHVRHIYRKLDVHSREELIEHLDFAAPATEPASQT